ncbi:MAG: Sua5/YciO/YrdC/YwlC family protein [Pseudomonadota bacterium]
MWQSTPLPPQGGGSSVGDQAALAAAVTALRAGKIVAVKGVGGYHLMCDATSDAAVAALRARKPRPAKPLAVMFPDLAALRAAVHTTPELDAFLASPERPIVLLPKRTGTTLAAGIAPGLAEIGCLLPYSPLHALLLGDLKGPLVATSGNLSGEPVLTDNHEAQARLQRVADAFLHHDRPIVRPADDPVYRVIAGRPRPIRPGRGSAPLELDLPAPLAEPVLALGSHMKNTLCLAWGTRAVVSPHIGELDSARSLDTLAQVAGDLQRLYQVQAQRLIVDRHPGFGYRRYARETKLPLTEIWHHPAHASALAWEFPNEKEWIVFAWDGVGLGADGSLWGGEAFTGAPGCWRHAASFRPFRLPGGDKAGREPWRAAAALLLETGADAPFAPAPLHQAWQARLNSPATSSVGRLFDAAAALTGVCTHASFEGEGPMRLEALLAIRPELSRSEPVIARETKQSRMPAESTDSGSPRPYWPRDDGIVGETIGGEAVALPLARDPLGIWRTDWAPLLPMLADAARPAAERAACFHLSLAQALAEQAQLLRAHTGIRSVGLTGGVFQNRVLAEAAIARLQAVGFVVYLPSRLPVNDAGVSFGQVIETLHS